MAVTPRRQAPRGELGKFVPYIAGGFAAGLLLGYIFLGTLHAIMTSRIHNEHAGDTTSTLQVADNKEQGFEGSASLKTQLQGAAGTIHQHPGKAAKADAKANKFPSRGTDIHTLCTSNGSPYLNFQTRIMYGTYKKVQSMPGGERLAAFTRILHRSKPDVLVDEVPTFRADPLTPLCDTWCEFPVSDRPNAVAQWLRATEEDHSMIKAPWLLMIETDYVWIKPPRAPPAEDTRAPSWAFPFSYIAPASPALEGVIRKMFPPDRGPTSRIPNSGPAPVMLRVEELFKVVPDWERLTAHIEADEESKKRLGWVREMYAFSVAAALQDVKLELLLPPKSPLISQPPADTTPGSASMLHYTWGSRFVDANGSTVWEFDKRTFTDKSIETQTPNIPLPPPFSGPWHLPDQKPVTRELYDTLVVMLNTMNAAVDLLPNLQKQVS